MTQRIRRVGVGQTAKVVGVLYLLVGLLLAPFLVLATMFAPEQAGFGVAFAVALPILYGCAGFVGAAIGCFIYNLVAGWVGGIEVDLGDAAA
jgi:inner membrane protein involved in colicin E2 resistance